MGNYSINFRRAQLFFNSFLDGCKFFIIYFINRQKLLLCNKIYVNGFKWIYLIFITFLVIKDFWLGTTNSNKFAFLYSLTKTYCSGPELLIFPFNAARQRKHSWNSHRKYTTRCCYDNHSNHPWQQPESK